MKRLLLALALALTPTLTWAQGCGTNNPNCIVPTAPPGTNDGRAASTAFVQTAVGGGGGGGNVVNGAQNSLTYYPNPGVTNTVGPLTQQPSSVLATDASSVPSLVTTLPTALTIPLATISSPTLAGNISGTANFISNGIPVVQNSANTGGQNGFQTQNNGVSSNSGTTAEFLATLNCVNCFTIVKTVGGASPLSQIQAGGGMTGGLNLTSNAGPITLSPTTNVVVGGTAPQLSALTNCIGIQTNASGVTSCNNAGSGIQFAIDAKASYNVKCDNSTNDTTAINNAIAAAAASVNTKMVILPSGTCIVTGALTISTAGVSLIGSGMWGTTIKQNTVSSPTITVTANNVEIAGLTIQYASTGTSGGNAINITTASTIFNPTIHDVNIANPFIGLFMSDVNQGTVYNFVVSGAKSASIEYLDASNVNLTSFLFTATSQSATFVTNCHIYMHDDNLKATHVQGNTLSQGDGFGGSCPLQADGAGNPAFNRFSLVHFDSGVTGALLNGAKAFSFTNCWFSTGRGGANISNGSGLILGSSSNEIMVIGSDFQANGASGVYIASATNVIIKGNRFDGNGTLTANTYDGVTVAAAQTDFHIEGNIIKNNIGSGTQRCAVFITSGASDRYTIASNLVSTNGTCTGGGSGTPPSPYISDAGTGTNKNVGNNW